MIEKLTANLKKSQAYGSKIKEQLKNIGQQVLQTKISITKLNESIILATKQNEDLQIAIKRQQQQISNYEYKRQKLEIRKKEITRKVQLQQQIFEKKSNYQQTLKNKIQTLENDIKKENIYSQEAERHKDEMEELGLKEQKQLIAIQNLYKELMVKNKNIRSKQDELYIKRNSNLKKKARLQFLLNALETENNKENQNLNVKEAKQMSRLGDLQYLKKDVSGNLNSKLSTIFQIYNGIQQLSLHTAKFKKQISKVQQAIQDAKNEKTLALKIRQSFEQSNKIIA